MTQRNGSRDGRPSLASFLLFELAFLVAYRLDMAAAHDAALPFQFSGAILLCGLLLSPLQQWWFYVLGTVPIRLLLFVPAGLPAWFPFAYAATESMKGLLSAALLQRFSRDRAWFDNLREFATYFLIAVVFAPAVSAFAGAGLHSVLGHSFWRTCAIWFFQGALANLVFAPIILLRGNSNRGVVEHRRYVEAFVLAAGLALATYLVIRNSTGAQFPPFLLYLPVPFLVWAAMRFGPLGVPGAALLMSIVSIAGADVLSMQLFLFLVSLPFFFLSVVVGQQRRQAASSEARLQSVVDAAPVMLWMSGKDGHNTFFNRTWLDFTGLSANEQAKQDWVARIHPEDRARSVMKYLSAFKSQENFTLEYRVMRNDGVYRWLLHNGSPRYANDGSFLGYIGTRVDFTDRREAEERLREVSIGMLNAQEMERCRIGYELHDDLAQKLSALSINLSRYSYECNGNSKLAAGLSELQQALRRISEDVVRLAGQLRPATVELLALSAALRNLCRQSTADKRTVLFVQNGELPPLREDVAMPLYRVAQESLQNALTHSGATYIHVELSSSATAVRLSVRDNGCGFVVGCNASAGLGLARMSRHLKSAGGLFSIISNPGEGTTITASMPLAQSMRVSSTA
jgi:PAS domain S-box-containing protein